MEIASTGKLVVRKATREDAGRIMALLRSAKIEHRHADWSYPSDWLGQPGFIVCERVCEREKSGSKSEMVACLAAAADPPPAAWIRLAAASKSVNHETVFVDMIQAVRTQLQLDGNTELAWLSAKRWPDDWFSNMGFELANWIITYVKFGLPEPNTFISPFRIRAAALKDLEELAAIEEAAFEPLWRHSIESLRSAFVQAACFDAAYLEDRLVGFHYSVRGIDDDTVHLVRITVHPEAQRSGVGSALMESAFESYRQQGFVNITLNTQLDNLASDHLYEKFGFRKLGEHIPMWVMKLTE